MTGDNVVIYEKNIDGGWQVHHVNPPPVLHPSALGYLVIFPLGLELELSFALFQLLTRELFAVLNGAGPHRARAARAL